MADSDINIEITEETPIQLEIVEDTPIEIELVATGPAGDDGVQSVVAGDNVTVDNTDPANPIVSAETGGDAVFQSISDVITPVDSADRSLYLGGVMPSLPAIAGSTIVGSIGDGQGGALLAAAFGAGKTPALAGIGGRGTLASPSKSLANDVLFFFGAGGTLEDGSLSINTGQVAGMVINAESDATTSLPMSLTLNVVAGSILTGRSNRTVAIGSSSAVPTERLLNQGRMELQNMSAPTSHSGYGKIWSQSDSTLHFMGQDGTDHNLLAPVMAAVNVSYDDTVIEAISSGLVTGDDTQEILDNFATVFVPYVISLFTRVPDAGGTTGQSLRKASNTDYDYVWDTIDQSDVGLGSVDNTSDADKPVSTATQTALNLKQDLSGKDVASGYAGLDGSGKINPLQLPATAITETFVVNSQVAMLALTAQTGDVAVRTDLNKSFILTADPASTLGNWQELLSPTDQVASVFGRQGVVTSQNGDYTGSQVTNVPAGSIASTTVQGAIDELDSEKQPLDSDLTTIAGLTAATDNFMVSVASAWASRTPAQARVQLGIGMVTLDATYNYLGISGDSMTPTTQLDATNGHLGGYGISTAGLGVGVKENWITRSATPAQSAWTKTNVTASDNSQPDPFGVAAGSSRVTGSASGATLVNTSTADTTTGFHTASVWLKLITAGASGGVVKIKLTTSADSTGAENTYTLPVGKWYRIAVPLNCASANTSKTITVTVNDNVVDWWGAQGNSGAEPFAPALSTSGVIAKSAGKVFTPLATIELNSSANPQSLTGSSGGITPSGDFNIAGGNRITWLATEVTGTTQALAVSQEYVANNAGLVTFTLPSAGAGVGSRIVVLGKGAGGWKIAQNASQIIHSSTFGNTTSGTGGSLSSGARYDCVTLRCIVSNLEWVVEQHEGTLTKV